jgi:hypothetical protein
MSEIIKLVEKGENIKKKINDLWLIKEIFTRNESITTSTNLFVETITTNKSRLKFHKSAGYEFEPFKEEIEIDNDMKKDFYDVILKYEARLNKQLKDIENKICSLVSSNGI